MAQVAARAGRDVPCEDPALSRAAAQIAAQGAHGLPGPLVLQRAVQDAGAGDPSPRALLLTVSDPAALGSALSARLQLAPSDNVYGVGVSSDGDGERAVVLLTQRQVAVAPLPKRVAARDAVRIEGRFLVPLTAPALFVEAPDGTVTEIKTTLSGDHFSARFSAQADGRFLVEVMARGAQGPEVLYLHPLEVGTAAQEPAATEPEPSGQDDAATVLDQINRERQRYGAAALAWDERLHRVAQSYAEELRELHLFAHISPRSGDLKSRLKRAGYVFSSAAENLAQGPSAVDANALAASSPAHRKAMLDASYTRCGIGLSRVMSGDGHSDVLLVELFARE